jgi:peptidoglycan-associated lipoprotein
MKRQLNPSLTALLCLTLFAVLVVGCKKETEEVVEEETTGAELPPEPEPEPVVEPVEEPCAFETVYFAFDSSELDSSARTSIQEAVECYRRQNPDVRLVLTGACDPRGTEEYNLALGQRRSQSVKSYMVSLGMSGNQLTATSVGEEMATGTDEASWALDRNVSATER